jgi:hypothetical protein
LKFKVEFVYKLDQEAYVMARQLEGGDFSLSASSRLDGAAIRPAVTQPRKLRSDGSPDLEVFAFILANPDDAASFRLGEVIELQP